MFSSHLIMGIYPLYAATLLWVLGIVGFAVAALGNQVLLWLFIFGANLDNEFAPKVLLTNHVAALFKYIFKIKYPVVYDPELKGWLVTLGLDDDGDMHYINHMDYDSTTCVKAHALFSSEEDAIEAERDWCHIGLVLKRVFTTGLCIALFDSVAVCLSMLGLVVAVPLGIILLLCVTRFISGHMYKTFHKNDEVLSDHEERLKKHNI